MHSSFMMWCLFLCALTLILCIPLSGQEYQEWHLVWSDEFDKDGLPDAEKWTFDVGNGCPKLCGWGNNELQYYTVNSKDNARVSDGVLIIEAHKQKISDSEFSSARLKSMPTGKWLYGKMEIKAKLPFGHGVWPAIWMLPADLKYGSWPRSGEIDIMEHVGYLNDSIFGTVHTAAFNGSLGTQKGGSIHMEHLTDHFNVYAIEWDADKIDFFVNGIHYFTFNRTADNIDEWPFDHEFFLILNLAVGGNWGGQKGVDPDIWPQRFEIDYVRVYQRQKT